MLILVRVSGDHTINVSLIKLSGIVILSVIIRDLQLVYSTTSRRITLGPYHKRKPNQAKRNSDFVRYYKRLAASLFNNFPQNNILVHWFTGTYADQRVKSIDTAKRDFKKFVYSFGLINGLNPLILLSVISKSLSIVLVMQLKHIPL